MALIYAVEDDKNILEIEMFALKNSGYQVDGFECAGDFYKKLEERLPDLILLDVMLPDEDGLEIVAKLRRRPETKKLPVIMVTAKSTEIDKVKGLDVGADDYLTKPIGTSELLARIRTALRHSNRLNTDSPLYKRPFHAKGLTIDFEKHLVSVDGKDVHLTQIEFKIISLLAQNSGRVMTYDTIISNIWGPYADDDNSILRVNMAHIRRKLEQNPAEPQYVFTEIGIGYRMIEDEMQ